MTNLTRCGGADANIVVSADVAKSSLPDGFSPKELAPGIVGAVLQLLHCDLTAVGGVTVDAASLVILLVPVKPPTKNAPSAQVSTVYMLEFGTNNSELRAWAKEWGLVAENLSLMDDFDELPSEDSLSTIEVSGGGIPFYRLQLASPPASTSIEETYRAYFGGSSTNYLDFTSSFVYANQDGEGTLWSSSASATAKNLTKGGDSAVLGKRMKDVALRIERPKA